ncbi:MAG: 6-phosphofructokinase [Lachnospiraceae bacterium]|nr:6-phosphofructokinase [Lachnospiraceae bacterium]
MAKAVKGNDSVKEIKTIGVLSSGGDAPGMNAAIRAVVRTAIANGLKVKGIRRGYTGLLEEDIIDMDATSVADTIQRGGTILYTARCPEFMTKEGQDKGAYMCRKHGIDGIVVIGGDGSFQGARKLAERGINTIGVPGTIDLDIACTEYTIGFDTAVNTAMEAIDKVRDTSTSHERCSIIEVMGRNAGYIALWCGIANGAEHVLITERYDHDEQRIINSIIERRKVGKKHHIIVNAEGIGDSEGMAKRIQAATGIETRATIIGHIQRGGSPTCKDRVYASVMGSMAADLLSQGMSNRVVAYRHGEFTHFDIEEALNMHKDIDEYMFSMQKKLSR